MLFLYCGHISFEELFIIKCDFVNYHKECGIVVVDGYPVKECLDILCMKAEFYQYYGFNVLFLFILWC